MFLASVRQGHVDEVRTHLVRGEDCNQRDYWGSAALHLAVDLKPPIDLKMLQVLLSAEGLELDAKEGVQQRTAAHLCASHGKADCLAALIAAGAQVSPRNAQGETPAHKAAQHGAFDVLELLVASGTLLDARDAQGRTPLHRCAELGSVECVKLLVVARAPLNAADGTGKTPLHVAAARGRTAVAQVLLENRADAKVRDETGKTAEEVAQSAGLADCAAALAAGRKVRLHRRGEIASWSVLDCVEWAAEEGLGETVCAALKKHDVSGDLLLRLTDDIMRDELGIVSWGARKKAAGALEQLGRGAEGAAAVAAAAAGAGHARSVVFEELVVGELLGMGNFGEVKRASWRGTDVAVKIIYRKAFHDKDQRQLFQKEVDIISQLHHPNIVQFIGTCLMPAADGREGNLVLVTEFCGGGSLRQLVAENSSALLRGNLRCRIARDVCRAMVHLHKWKPPILHRDLTSSNLLLDHSLTCKLADFGLSRESFKDRTLTGGFGAVAWMDPEVLRGAAPYTMASDVYAFGMCCYEMVAFCVPNSGHSPLRFADMTCRGHRPPLGPSVPPEWVALIEQAWSADQAARPSFVELLARVEAMPVRKEPPREEARQADDGGGGDDGGEGMSGAQLDKLVGSDGYVNV